MPDFFSCHGIKKKKNKSILLTNYMIKILTFFGIASEKREIYFLTFPYTLKYDCELNKINSHIF